MKSLLPFLPALAVLPAAAPAFAAPSQGPGAALPGVLVLIAAGVAIVVAAVAVLRLYRSAFEGKPKDAPRDPR